MLVKKKSYNTSVNYSNLELSSYISLIRISRITFLLLLCGTITVVAMNRGLQCSRYVAFLLLICIALTFIAYTIFILGRESLISYIEDIINRMDGEQRNQFIQENKIIKVTNSGYKIFGKEV